MDELYIKMCKNAKEIQEQWEPKSGNMILRSHTIFGEEIDKKIWDSMESCEILVRPVETSVKTYWYGTDNKTGQSVTLTQKELYKNTCVWLPRQEDLQKIYKQIKNVCYDGGVFLVFSSWVTTKIAHLDLDFNQMWLCFVMETVYNKQWNGETWTVIK